jgi:hypothetical protein
VADLTPNPGTLVFCSPAERDLIYAIRKDGGMESAFTDTVVRRITGHEDALLEALRADPDQHVHIVEVEPEGDDWFTIRHPIMERMRQPGGDLWDCGVFDALQRLDSREWPQEVGRYRVRLEVQYGGDGTEPVGEMVDFEGPLT